MFETIPEVIVRHVDHGDTLLNGYHTVRDGYPGTRPKKSADFGSDPDPVTGRTRQDKRAGQPGPTRTGGTPTVAK